MEEPAGDRDLIERCRAGSEAAFRELVDQYKGLVFSMISRSIADRNRVEDLAQEVFLRVHRGLPYFRGDARLSTWICRIVMDVCADNRPRGQRELSMDDEQAGASVQAAACEIPLGTVKTQLHRAKRELRELLDPGVAKGSR